MSLQFQSAAIYLLGFAGLAAIGLLPFRSWQLLKDVLAKDARQAQRKAVAVIAILLVLTCLWSDVQIVMRIYRCLNETYCGPSVASGWMYLAMLGVVYFVFEVVSFLMRKVGRIRGAAQAQEPQA